MNIFGMENEDGLFLDFWVLIKYKKKDDDVKGRKLFLIIFG